MRNRWQRARSRAHCARQKTARARSARAYDLRTAAVADGRFDRTVAQRFENPAQRCDRIDRPPPQRFAS
eukprot:1612605-Lingulodinium_polyedra.AAC.1